MNQTQAQLIFKGIGQIRLAKIKNNESYEDFKVLKGGFTIEVNSKSQNIKKIGDFGRVYFMANKNDGYTGTITIHECKFEDFNYIFDFDDSEAGFLIESDNYNLNNFALAFNIEGLNEGKKEYLSIIFPIANIQLPSLSFSNDTKDTVSFSFNYETFADKFGNIKIQISSKDAEDDYKLSQTKVILKPSEIKKQETESEFLQNDIN